MEVVQNDGHGKVVAVGGVAPHVSVEDRAYAVVQVRRLINLLHL